MARAIPIELFFGGGLPGQYVAGDTSSIPLTTQPGTHRLPSEMRMLLLATVFSPLPRGGAHCNSLPREPRAALLPGFDRRLASLVRSLERLYNRLAKFLRCRTCEDLYQSQQLTAG